MSAGRGGFISFFAIYVNFILLFLFIDNNENINIKKSHENYYYKGEQITPDGSSYSIYSECKYCVVFKGDIIDGNEYDKVKLNIANMLQTDASGIEHLFSGELKIIKKNLDFETSQKIKQAFQKAGAICYVKKQKDTTLRINTLDDFKNEFGESTWKLIILSFITGGLYNYLWLVARQKSFNRITQKNIVSMNLIIGSFIIFWINISLYIFLHDVIPKNILEALINSFSLILLILSVIIILRISKGLEEYFFSQFGNVIHFNRFYAILFQVYYINYSINHIGKMNKKKTHKRKKNIDRLNEIHLQIEKLALLAHKGILTDEEFKIQKAKLLELG